MIELRTEYVHLRQVRNAYLLDIFILDTTQPNSTRPDPWMDPVRPTLKQIRYNCHVQ